MNGFQRWATLTTVEVVVTVLWGWVLSWLWLWFVVPVVGFAPITIAQGVGLRVVATVFGVSNLIATGVVIAQMPEKVLSPRTQAWGIALANLVAAIGTLFLGWVVHFFTVGA